MCPVANIGLFTLIKTPSPVHTRQLRQYQYLYFDQGNIAIAINRLDI